MYLSYHASEHIWGIHHMILLLKVPAGNNRILKDLLFIYLLISLTTLKPFNMWITTSLENSYRDGNTRSPYLPPENPVCRTRSNSQNWTWNNGLVPDWERSTTRLYIVTLFNFYAEYIMQNAGLDESQAGIKTARRNSNNLRYADDTPLMAESKELKSLLMRVKEESEKASLKLNIQ